jgi:hypothetical protein
MTNWYPQVAPPRQYFGAGAFGDNKTLFSAALGGPWDPGPGNPNPTSDPLTANKLRGANPLWAPGNPDHHPNKWLWNWQYYGPL